MELREIEDRVVGIIRARHAEFEPARHRATPLGELGMDSLERLNVVFDIEESFRIAIPDEALENVSTVDDLVARVAEIVASVEAGGTRD